MALGRRTVLTGVGVTLAVAVGVLIAYRLISPPIEPPAQVVQSVLELRQERSTDASAYALYFESPDVAQMLAQDASESVPPTGSPGAPIPQWQPPYVSAQTSGSAEVVVVWKKDRAFEEWADATLFKLVGAVEDWRITDAEELTGTVPPALGSTEETSGP